MTLKPYPADVAKTIEADLNGWVAHMKAIRDTVPDFWSELNTAERLGEWLAACGYRKSTP